MADFVEIGLENDLSHFLSVHLTKLYSVNMAEPQHTRRHSQPGRQKVRVSYICHDRQSAGFPGAIRHQTKNQFHNDVTKWKHFLRYWPFVWGIHRSPVNSLHKGQ